MFQESVDSMSILRSILEQGPSETPTVPVPAGSGSSTESAPESKLTAGPLTATVPNLPHIFPVKFPGRLDSKDPRLKKKIYFFMIYIYFFLDLFVILSLLTGFSSISTRTCQPGNETWPAL